MEIEEFSNEFDVLVHLDSANAQLSFDEYLKSVCLTKAQTLVVLQLYADLSQGFEQVESTRRQLDALVTPKTYTSDDEVDSVISDTKHHTRFVLPSDCWYLVYEQVKWKSDDTCIDGFVADVIPVLHDEYRRVVNNPFRGSTKRRALRLDNGSVEAGDTVELVSDYDIKEYLIQYIKLPKPIILTDLPEELSIDGYTEAMGCELSPSIHKQILEVAVKLALLGTVAQLTKS